MASSASIRSTAPRLVCEAAALASRVTCLFSEVVGLVDPPPDASLVQSSVRGCALVASLRLRLASSWMACCCRALLEFPYVLERHLKVGQVVGGGFCAIKTPIGPNLDIRGRQ